MLRVEVDEGMGRIERVRAGDGKDCSLRTFGTFASGRRTGGQHEERRCRGQPGLRKAAHVTSCAIAATCRPSAGAAATLRAKSRPSSPFPDRGLFRPGSLAIPAPNAAAVSLKALESPLALVYLGSSICGHAC